MLCFYLLQKKYYEKEQLNKCKNYTRYQMEDEDLFKMLSIHI